MAEEAVLCGPICKTNTGSLEVREILMLLSSTFDPPEREPVSSILGTVG